MITNGQLLLLAGSLLVSAGLLLPFPAHPDVNPSDILAVVFLWSFSLCAFRFHRQIFERSRILVTVLPVLFFGFLWLLLNLNYLLMFGRFEPHLYAVLFGWFLFNVGLYYDTRKVLKEPAG